jgi:1-acyl-sn-glycerol-3-phosphate acyltransferase
LTGENQPRYRVPWRIRWLGVQRIVRGQPASCAADMARMLAVAPAPPRFDGLEHIPLSGPLLVTQNHFSRPGLGAWWATSLAFTAIARARGHEPVWMVTSEWYYQDFVRSAVITPLTRWLFGRAARVWGFLPMPPDERDLARRAAAVRQTLERARALFAHGGALGIAPEGRGETVLLQPPAGAGRVLLRLAAGITVLPVGICEEEGRLVGRFGPAYTLARRPGEEKRDEDARIASEVMAAIAALLPPAMRGPYGAAVHDGALAGVFGG